MTIHSSFELISRIKEEFLLLGDIMGVNVNITNVSSLYRSVVLEFEIGEASLYKFVNIIIYLNNMYIVLECVAKNNGVKIRLHDRREIGELKSESDTDDIMKPLTYNAVRYYSICKKILNDEHGNSW